MKKKTVKRVLAFVLSLVMMLSVLPAAAFAEEPGDPLHNGLPVTEEQTDTETQTQTEEPEEEGSAEELQQLLNNTSIPVVMPQLMGITPAAGDAPINNGTYDLANGPILVEVGGTSNSLKITQGTNAPQYMPNQPYIITGTYNGAQVPSGRGGVITVKGVSCQFFLYNANISGFSQTDISGIYLEGNSNVILELYGDNIVKNGGEWVAPVSVPKGETLTISGNGRLTAETAYGGTTAIGTGYNDSAGTIKILNGEVNAVTNHNFFNAIGAFNSGSSAPTVDLIEISGENTVVTADEAIGSCSYDDSALAGKKITVSNGATVNFTQGVTNSDIFRPKSILTANECKIYYDGELTGNELAGVYSTLSVTGGTSTVSNRPSYWGAGIVKSGTEVTLTPSSSLNEWQEGAWTVTEADGSHVTVTPGSNNTVTFTMPESRASASFVTTLKTYAITYTNMEGATNHANNKANYKYGGAFTLGTPTKPNFKFVEWRITGENGDITTGVGGTDYGDKTFYAVWAPDFSGSAAQIILDQIGYYLSYDKSDAIRITAYDNFDTSAQAFIQDIKYTFTVTGTDDDVDGVSQTQEAARVGSSTSRELYFDAATLPKVTSKYVGGKYQPVYSVNVTAEIAPAVGDKYEIANVTADVYILPPVVSIKTGADAPAYAVAGKGSVSVPFTISNLSEEIGYDVGYTISKNGTTSTTVNGSQGNIPSVFTKTVKGNIAELTGRITIPNTTPSGVSDIYTVNVYGRNTGQASDANYAHWVTVINSSLAHLKAEYSDSAYNPHTLSTGGTYKGAALTTIAGMTSAASYDSASVYNYIMTNRLSNNRLTLAAPQEWGNVRYKVGVGDFSAFAPVEKVYAMSFKQGASTAVQFEWERSGSVFTHTFTNDSLAGKVYLVNLGKNLQATFQWSDGTKAVQKKVTPADGIYVLYSNNAINRLDITLTDGTKTYYTTINSPKSVSFPDSASQITKGTTSKVANYKLAEPSLPVNNVALIEKPNVILSFTEQGGGTPAGDITVNYIVTDKNLIPITSGLPDGAAGSQTIAGSSYLAINYAPLIGDNTRIIFAEILQDGKTPLLLPINYPKLVALGAGTKSTNLSHKIVLPKTTDGVLSVQPAIIEDDTGVKVLYGSVNEPTSFVEGNSAYYTAITYAGGGVVNSNNLKLQTGTRITLTSPTVRLMGGRAGDTITNMFMLPRFNIKSKFTKGSAQKDVKLLDADRVIANVPAFVARTMEENLAEMLRSTKLLPEVGKDAFAMGSKVGDFNLGELASGFMNLELETPTFGLPFSFVVSKSDDVYIVKGVYSHNLIPDPENTAEEDFGKIMEGADEVLNMFNKVSNEFYSSKNPDSNTTVGLNMDLISPMSADAFIGFRAFVSGRATYDAANSRYIVEFNDIGGIAEISADYSNRIPVAGVAEVAVSYGGSVKSTLKLENPTPERKQRKSAATNVSILPMDIWMYNEIEAKASARVGVGTSIYIASAYAGIKGSIDAAYKIGAVLRDYLPNNDTERYQEGSELAFNGKLQLYVTTSVLMISVTKTYDIAEVNKAKYYPDNATNPYKPKTSAGVTRTQTVAAPIGQRYVPLNAARSGYTALISNVDSTAAAHYVGNQKIYKDLNFANDYNDDRIKTLSGGSVSTNKPEYALSASSGSSRGIAGWEMLKNNISDEVDSLDEIEQLNYAMGLTEIVGGYYNGSSWNTQELSDNDMMDMAPKTAYNETANKGVIVWTRGNATAKYETSGGAKTLNIGIENAELAYSYFDGGNFSAPGILLGGLSDKKIAAYTPAIDDAGNIVVTLQYEDGSAAVITKKNAGDPQYSALNIKNATGVKAIWDGSEFILGYVDTGSEQESGTGELVLAELSNDGQLQDVMARGFAGRVNGAYRFVRDMGKQGLTSVGAVWHESGTDETGEAQTQLYGALLTVSDGVAYFTTAKPIGAVLTGGLTVASHDARLKSGKLDVLSVCATDATSAFVREDSVEFKNEVIAGIHSYDVMGISPGAATDFQLIVQNNGIDPIESLKILIGESETNIGIVILPGESKYVTASYTPGDAALTDELEYTVTATFDGGGTANCKRTYNIYQVDIGVNQIDFTTDEQGSTLLVNVANMSDLKLRNDSIVTVGVYTDLYGEDEFVSPVTLSGGDITTLMASGYEQQFSLPPITAPTTLYVITSTADSSSNPVRDINKANNFFQLPISIASGVQSITLSPNNISIAVGKTQRLTAAVDPAGAADKTVVWSSADTGIATVSSDGTVTGVSAGSTIITGSSVDGSAYGECTVVVTAVGGSPSGSPSGSSSAGLILTPNTPVIMGENGTTGWSAIKGKLSNAENGGSVTIDMNGVTKVPAEIFESIAGRDVTVVFDMGDGISWTVNGLDIPTNTKLKELDIKVERNTSNIPSSLTEGLFGADDTAGHLEITITHNGEFGFKMTLSVDMGAENNGLTAKLYHYLENSGKLEETGTDTIRNGAAQFELNGASSYAIVLSGQIDAWRNPFGDVSANDWFYEDVRYVHENGLFAGTNSTSFSPKATMTRAMLATVLWRMEGSPTPKSENKFTDLNADWYKNAVIWANESGIVSGYGNGLFVPDDNITREQAVVMLKNYSEYKGYSINELADISAYADVGEISGWALEAMRWAIGADIITGRTTKDIVPKGVVSRAEVATILHRYSYR